MRSIVLTILTIIMLASCKKQEAMLSNEELARRDSLALRVAVSPVMDCLPAYYAKRMGMFDSLNVDVRLVRFNSEMDLDTALIYDRVHLGYTSYPRLVMMERKRLDTLNVIAEMPGQLYLITARTKRIRNLKQLKERLVALDRYTPADYWSDEIMKKAGLDQAAIYRPQFNDVQLRSVMLQNQLVDAAILPEPYATQTKLKGNRQLLQTPDSGYFFNCWVSTLKTENDKRLQKLKEQYLKGYDWAVAELNQNPNKDTLRAIFHSEYNLPLEVADSMNIPKFKPLSSPSGKGRQTCQSWVQERLSIK